MAEGLARHSVLFLVLAFSAAPVALAQKNETGSLTGTVTDQQGGVIPGAIVLAKNEGTGSEFGATANERGIWKISSVPSGSYTVSVKAPPPFRTETFDEIRVDTGTTVTVNAILRVGLATEVTVTASRFEQDVIDAPATVSVVSKQAIEAIPSQNVADLLRAVPGINVTQLSASSYGVNGRAASSAYSWAQLALVDGRTLYEDSMGSVPWNIVPTELDDIKQIEVIRGPASAVWGAYAMNGVINIITKPPREMLGTTVTFGIGTFDRSGGIAESNTGSLYYVNAAHAQVLSDRWAFRLTGGAYTQDAFARPKTIPSQNNLYPNPSFKNKGTTQPKIEGRIDYDLPDGKQHFTFSGGYAFSSGILHGPGGGSRADMSSSYGKVDYTRSALRVSGYVNSFASDGSYLIRFTPAGEPLPWIDHSRSYNLEFSDLRKVGARNLFSYGGNVRHSGFIDLSFAPNARNRNEGGAYLQDEILLSDYFRWVVGARIDKFSNLEGAVFSPRTTFMVKPTPGQTFRVSYNRAYVAPNAMDNYWQEESMSWWDLEMISPLLAGYSYPVRFEGSRNLKAPSLDAYEVGYSAAIAKDRIHLGAAFYINDTRHEISTGFADSYTSQNPPPGWPLPLWVLDAMIEDPDAFGPGLGLPSLVVVQNRSEGSKTRNKGLELSIEALLSRTIDVFSNYSWQAKPVTSGFNINEINQPPAHRFNAGMNFNHKRYLGNVSVGYVGRAYWQDVVLYGGWTDAYTVINLSAGVRLDAIGKYMAMIKISNLANSLVQNHIYGDILKRQITGEFKMRF